MRIAAESNGRCVARGISIMRLALGYEDPLPEPVDYAPVSRQMPLIFGQCFPRHTVYVFTAKGVVEDLTLPPNVVYSGDSAEGWLLDDYLWAFSYMPDGGAIVHFVIGSPVVYEGTKAHQIFAIELP